MRKLNNKGPWCSMCKAYGHSDTKCPNLDKHLDTLAMVISTHTLGDEWLDESGALDLQMLVDHSNRLLNILHESMKALEASGKLGTNGLPLKGSRNLLYKAIMAKKKQHNYKIAGEKRRGQSRTRASKCGYCRNVGHTRRTCETMKKDQTLVLNANRLYRKQFAARMNSLSLGAGSLLKFTLNNEGVVGRNHGWYKNYPDSFLSIVPELAFKDCTVFNMITSYDYMHRAVINHHLIANTDVNHRLGDPLYIVSNARFFDGSFGSNEQRRHAQLGPDSSVGNTAYNVAIIKPCKGQEFTQEWINEETPWFMEIFKKAKSDAYDWSSALNQIQRWYDAAKVNDV